MASASPKEQPPTGAERARMYGIPQHCEYPRFREEPTLLPAFPFKDTECPPLRELSATSPKEALDDRLLRAQHMFHEGNWLGLLACLKLTASAPNEEKAIMAGVARGMCASYPGPEALCTAVMEELAPQTHTIYDRKAERDADDGTVEALAAGECLVYLLNDEYGVVPTLPISSKFDCVAVAYRAALFFVWLNSLMVTYHQKSFKLPSETVRRGFKGFSNVGSKIPRFAA